MARKSALIIFLFFFNFFFITPLAVQGEEAVIRDIFFPTDPDKTNFTDSFGDGRYEHSHEGTDIMGEQMLPLYAAVDGYVAYLTGPEAAWGYHLEIKDAEGYSYHYIHINNDTPGTDDGLGGIEHAYASGIERGSEVSRGQLIAWMGDSGNAENVGHHLHFEIRLPDDTAINAYPSLLSALNPKIDYDIETAMNSSPDINTDKSIASKSDSSCVSGSLLKIEGQTSVYYCGADGKRYVFPNERIYFSWYADFSNVMTILSEEIAAIPLGGNATYRPGVKLVKLQTDPKVYAVERNGTLRWIRSAETAAVIFGDDWNKKIDDLPDAFFMDYKVGEPI